MAARTPARLWATQRLREDWSPTAI